MFDIAFSEMLIIAVVALIVLGPERLPKVARTAGHLLGRMQRYVNDVKSDINREMQLDELKKLQAQVAESARSLETSISSEMNAAESSLREATEAPKAAVAEIESAVAEVKSEVAATSLTEPTPASSTEPPKA
ncbi:MAG: Sec-independent protein translocase subunit TatB [Zoogloeaceae bacterium]|nr:Sec-independent protein translocase subunit TatB [Zoogloeaceae bacterium]